jgi:hypothetical protein
MQPNRTKSEIVREYLVRQHSICNYGSAAARSGDIEFIEIQPEVYRDDESIKQIRKLVRDTLRLMQIDILSNLVIILNSEKEPNTHSEAEAISRRVLLEVTVAVKSNYVTGLSEEHLANLIANSSVNDYLAANGEIKDPLIDHKSSDQMRSPYDRLFAFAGNSLYPLNHPRYLPCASIVLTSRHEIEEVISNQPEAASKIISKSLAGVACPYSTKKEFVAFSKGFTPIIKSGMDGRKIFRVGIPEDLTESQLGEIAVFKKGFYEFPLRTSS